MKSFAHFLLVLVVVSLPASAEFRTLVSDDGKSMKAELVSHAGGKVTIKREDGKTFEVNPSIFCAQDEEMIAAWMKENPAKIDYRLKAEATKKVAKSTEYSTTSYYEISLRNNGQQTIKGITVMHRVIYADETRRRPIEDEYVLDQDLEFNRTLVIKTDTFYESRSARGRGVKGCLIRVLDPKGEVILDWGADEVGMKGVTWENTDPDKADAGGGDKVEIR